jgi:signal transduction histidine kinase
LDQDGNIAKAVHIITDITERKRAEKELRDSREQLRNNLSGHLQFVREQERTLIAAEIHDDLGQSLVALKMDISWLAKKLPKDQKPLLEKL